MVWTLWRFKPSRALVRNADSYLRLTDHPKTITNKMRNKALKPEANIAAAALMGTVTRYKSATKPRIQAPVAQYIASYVVILPRRLRYLKNNAIMLTKQVRMHNEATIIKAKTSDTKNDCRNATLQELLVSKLCGLRMNHGFWTTRTSPANTSDPKNPTTKMTF